MVNSRYLEKIQYVSAADLSLNDGQTIEDSQIFHLCTLHNSGKQGIYGELLRKYISHKLRVLSPEICKQSLVLKNWKSKVRAE